MDGMEFKFIMSIGLKPWVTKAPKIFEFSIGGWLSKQSFNRREIV